MLDLGKIAILNGRFKDKTKGLLEDFIKDKDILINIEQVYYDHSQLIKLAKQDIDTILISEPFAYQDKIFDIYDELVKISKNSNWKPKRIINTMEYGKEAFYLMAKKTNLDFYQLEYNFDINSDLDFILLKTKLSPKELKIAKMKYGFIFD